MDKYEYKVRADEIKELIAQGEYVQAAEIADTIDWRRVKSVMMLCTISDLYRNNRRYEDAKNMLLLAYERRPGGRTICYSLCELCIKTEEFVSAVNYYKEYVQAAPKDPGRYILQYKIYEAQGVSLEERIGVLEELKKRDYREKWAYELAYLYHRVGLATRCVEECDELILWFGEGKYVVKAMELKMLHEPLTPSQQQKYDHRFDEPVQKQEETEEQEDGSWNASGQRQADGQWGSYGGAQEESQGDAYGQTQGEGQWSGYDQTQGEGQWNGYDQTQGEGQWNGYDQAQGEDQWNGYDQAQGEGQWNGYDHVQGESQWNGYDQSQGEGQWNGYDRSQGEGQWNGYDQTQEESQWGADAQSQADGQWETDGQFQDRGQWEVYGQSGGYEDNRNESYAPAAIETETSISTDAPEDLDIQVKTMDVSQYNTINLQAELAAGLQEVLGAEEIADSFLASAPTVDENSSDVLAEEALEQNSAEVMDTVEAFSGDTAEDENAEPGTFAEEMMQGERLADTVEAVNLDNGEQAMTAEASPEDEEAAGAEVQDCKLSEPAGAEAEDCKLSGPTGTEAEDRMLSQPAGAEAQDCKLLESAEAENCKPLGAKAAEVQGYKQSMPAVSSINDIRSAARQVPIDNDDSVVVQTEQDIVRDDTAELVLAQMRLENARKKQAETSEQIQKETAPKESMREPSQEAAGQNSVIVPERMMVEKQITGQMKIEDILAEWEQTKRKNEEKYKEEIRQDILRQTGPMFTEFEAAARDGLLERLEKGEAVELEEVILPLEPISSKKSEDSALPGKLIQMDEIRRISGKTKKANESRGEASGNIGQVDAFQGAKRVKGSGRGDERRESGLLENLSHRNEVRELENTEVLAQGYSADEVEDAKDLAQGGGGSKNRNSERSQIESLEAGSAGTNSLEVGSRGMDFPEAESMGTDSLETGSRGMDFPEAESMGTDSLETGSNGMDFLEAESMGTDSLETGSNGMDFLETESIETDSEEAGSMQAASLEIGEKAEAKDGAIARATAEAAETSSLEESAEGRAIERDKVKVRGLTREEKELYAPFIQSRSAREKLVQAIDNISMAAYTGNVVITGEEGMDTMTFAKNMIREVQMTDSNFSGKVAKISGESLNGRDVNETLWNLNNGALIIYRASGMEARTASVLHKALQQENLGIIIILEDTKKAIQRMFLGTPELYGDFTARMDLEALSNDTLVAFGKRYAREKEYSIDNLGVLALHTRIEELQTIDHVVTVVEVKKIVDEAIRHACRKTLGHFFDILFSKRYDEEDMIILTEKDFAY